MGTGIPCSLSVTLPLPPSVNEYWKPLPNGRGLYLTKSAKQFRTDVGWLMKGKPTFGDAELAVMIQWHMTDRRSDVDNRIKPVLDALEHAGTFDDDRQVVDIRAVKMHPVKGGRCHVKVWTLQRDDDDLSNHP